MNQSGFIYGGDYNPEQWLAMPEILEQDIEYMKVSGCGKRHCGFQRVWKKRKLYAV